MDRQGSAQDLNTSRFLNFAADEVLICGVVCVYIPYFHVIKHILSISAYSCMSAHPLSVFTTHSISKNTAL